MAATSILYLIVEDNELSASGSAERVLSDRSPSIGSLFSLLDFRRLTSPPTGTWVDCEGFTLSPITTNHTHNDDGFITASCNKIHYRAPVSTFERVTEGSIIFGVLSSSGGSGPDRRQSIRSTWAKGVNRQVFFLVGGPWDDIADEYERYRDLVWIDEEEVYDGVRSVLTLKTYSFIGIVHEISLKLNTKYSYLFKTDDDSFVNVDRLEWMLDDLQPAYFGNCISEFQKVNRDTTFKWYVSEEIYPEPYYPRYCQGAGYAMSKEFVRCAVESDYVSNVRLMAFEDVAVGLLAKRCNAEPVSRTEEFYGFRAGRENKNNVEVEKEVWRTRNSEPDPDDDAWMPPADMKNKILQHHIKTAHDMKQHQLSLTESTTF